MFDFDPREICNAIENLARNGCPRVAERLAVALWSEQRELVAVARERGCSGGFALALGGMWDAVDAASTFPGDRSGRAYQLGVEARDAAGALLRWCADTDVDDTTDRYPFDGLDRARQWVQAHEDANLIRYEDGVALRNWLHAVGDGWSAGHTASTVRAVARVERALHRDAGPSTLGTFKALNPRPE